MFKDRHAACLDLADAIRAVYGRYNTYISLYIVAVIPLYVTTIYLLGNPVTQPEGVAVALLQV